MALVKHIGCVLTLGAIAHLKVPVQTPNGANELTRYTFKEYHMGVDARITVYASSESQVQSAVAAAYERIADLDTKLSDYRPASELNRLCDSAGSSGRYVSRDLFTVLQRAEEVSKFSNGAFDVTCGPLVRLWRAARKTGKLPAPEAIMRARRLVGWEKVHLDTCDRSVRLDTPGMRLDLGGIAKGYACDEAQKVLKRHGISRALVEMGGDMVLSGPPPGTGGWSVQVPNAGPNREGVEMHFQNCAISTSGDTEQFVVIGGVQYSHVVNPRTGYALTDRVQATVIAPHGLLTDPLSTTITVMANTRVLSHYPGVKSYVKVLRGGP